MGTDRPYSDPKRSLILAGGGMRVAYQAGVLVALEEAGLRFDHVDGTSGGILNTAMMASGISAKEIAERWRSLKIKSFVSGQEIAQYLKPLSMTGYADADNIRKEVFPHLGIDLQKIRSNTDFEATFNVCNFSDKSVEAIPNHEVSEDHLIAGVSLPLMMPALQIAQKWYTDAVWIKDAHLMEAVRRGGDELWLVWAIGNAATYFPGAFNQYVHMIEMSANGALLEEFQQIELINQMIAMGVSIFGQNKPIRLFVVKAPEPLPLDPDLFFNKINTRELINMGYAHTKSCLAESPFVSSPMDAQATKNEEAGTVLRFRAVFNGVLTGDDLPTKAVYYTYFTFSRRGGKPFLNFYSSVFLSHLNQEVVGYHPQIHAAKWKNGWRFAVTSQLLIRGEAQQISAEFVLTSPVDFLLGLDMKHCHMSIAKHGTVHLEGNLYQPLSHRLKSCFFSQVIQGGKQAGLRTKLNMLSKLMDYEV